MKRLCFYILGAFFFAYPAFSAEPDLITEAESLGEVAGEGLACQASKYDTYELLARAYITTKAPNNDLLVQALSAYANSKITAFLSSAERSFADCAQNRTRFDNQAIFKTVIYGDGTLKTPDGKILKPAQPYDASKLYQKDPTERDKILKAYQSYQNRLLNSPAYQKVLKEQGI